jgi:acetyl-CoA acetyltransferase
MTKVAIAGVGYTPFTRKSGRSVLDLAAEACRNAAADAGLPVHEIDGVGSFSVFNDSVPCSAVATALALPGLRYTLDLNAAGQSPCHTVAMAALAIGAGHADAIVIFRALNGRSGMRIGHGAIPGGAGAYRYPIGYSSYVWQGYWRRPEATAESYAGGWFRTGDMATRDAEGYITILDRKPSSTSCG